MMVYAYVHGIKQFRENELSIQKSVFKRLRVEHCISSNSRVVDSSCSVCVCLVPFQQFLQQLRLANLPSQVSVSGLAMSNRSTIIEIYLK